MQRHVLVYLYMTIKKLNYAFVTKEKSENL